MGGVQDAAFGPFKPFVTSIITDRIEGRGPDVNSATGKAAIATIALSVGNALEAKTGMTLTAAQRVALFRAVRAWMEALAKQAQAAARAMQASQSNCQPGNESCAPAR